MGRVAMCACAGITCQACIISTGQDRAGGKFHPYPKLHAPDECYLRCNLKSAISLPNAEVMDRRNGDHRRGGGDVRTRPSAATGSRQCVPKGSCSILGV